MEIAEDGLSTFSILSLQPRLPMICELSILLRIIRISALDELLADRAALSSLAGSLSITNAEARAVLDALPEDLAPERRASWKLP